MKDEAHISVSSIVKNMPRVFKSMKNSSAWDRTWPLSVVIEGVHCGSQAGNYSNPSTPLSFISDDASRISPTSSIEENNNQKLDDAPRIDIRVRGDWSIRQVIATIVEESKHQIDWTEHALWWPAKKVWLHSMKSSLEQYEIPANAELHFTPKHKMLRIQLTNHVIEELSVDFSVPVVQAVSKLAAQLNIRHSEEMSLSRPLNDKMLRRNSPSAGLSASELQRPSTPQRQLSTTSVRTNSPAMSTLPSPAGTFIRQPSSMLDTKSTLSISSSTLNRSISNMTMTMDAQTRARLPRPKSFLERARLNSAWLNSSRSLYEQDVRPWDMLELRFKYLDFADLDLSKDVARINYIYEQLRWAVINDEMALDVAEADVYNLAAISLQVASKSGMLPTDLSDSGLGSSSGGIDTSMHTHHLHAPSISVTSDFLNSNSSGYHSSMADYSTSGVSVHGQGNGLSVSGGMGSIAGGNSRGSYSSGTDSPTWTTDEAIDSALSGLERSLDKSPSGSSPTTDSLSRGSPFSDYNDRDLLVHFELLDRLKVTSSKGPAGTGTMRKLLTSGEKTLLVRFKGTFFSAFKYNGEPNNIGKEDLGDPLLALNLRRCEVQPAVKVKQNRFEFAIIEFFDGNSTKNGTQSKTSGSAALSTIYHLVRCKDEKEYARWYTACSYASNGKTIADPSFKDDVEKTLRLLQIQSAIKPTTMKTMKKPGDNKENSNGMELSKQNIDLSEFVPKRILKRKSKEQIYQKIQSLHHSYTALPALDAQLKYINTVKMSIYNWDVTLFVIKQVRHKKTELLGISPEKIYLIDPNTGHTTASWKYQSLFDWKVNWEVKQMCINFRSEETASSSKTQLLEFDCLSADCKIIHEFIGGYIYMSLRHKKTGSGSFVQCFDQKAFLELTGDQEDVEPDLRKEHLASDRENIRPYNY